MEIQKIAVVTGAGGTLCSEMAKDLARQGYHVALLGRNLDKLQIVEKEIVAAGGVAISVPTDVANEDSVREAKEVIQRELGVCSVLINGAGGNQMEALTNITEFDERELLDDGSVKGFFNLNMDVFQSVIDVNTMGTVLPSFVFGKEMARHKRGVIINIASMNSFRPLTKVGAYGIAKAGIANFTQWLAAYLAPAGIRVNAIAPGFFLNDRSRKIMFNEDGSKTARAESVLGHTPQKRFGEAAELLGCMNWLINDDAAGFVTGIIVPVDGGFLSNAGV
ncbi:SDR family NAD(P)-dependent oxidoreductase [Dyadobacter sp. CY107]|uniref:SDR family NAD(P)-dependent oxidoreductase n=1 Tax=Dyadobacter fanqingshengii TaxID=2906443 RepID=UPI001F358568|nr:SDR family NAD(P)-dependent oxidoreductase [Dyadobacter fanqingshengii]MCF2505232.1 SDR family NAD(P)-dependent oxidoreductase [Dyadobacter fanqingshengii]